MSNSGLKKWGYYIIPISTWSMGMYLCEVLADGEVLFTDKLIKE